MGVNGRKGSISQASGNQTPGSQLPNARPGMRRRDTSDSLPPNNNTSSPITNLRSNREESQISTPPPSLLRRRTDFKEGSFGPSLIKDTKQDAILDSPFGSFKRTNTGPFTAGIAGPSSPWSNVPQSAGLPQMGAFGNFSLGGGQPATPGEKKAGFGSLRGESRFKGLMSKDIVEDSPSKLKDKTSSGSLEKLMEHEAEVDDSSWDATRPMRVAESEAHSMFDSRPQTGSAVLGGDDVSPPSRTNTQRFGLDQSALHDDIGFSTMESKPDTLPFRDMMQRRESQQFPQHYTPQSRQFTGQHAQEPMSPTDTNPYQSPEGERAHPDQVDIDSYDAPNSQMSAEKVSHTARAFNSAYEGNPADRSQTSSAGSRTFAHLGGFGGIGNINPGMGWSAAPGAVGTPTRANPGFASSYDNSIISSFGDIQSPGQAGPGAFGGSSSFYGNNTGTLGRGSKMGSLFPPAMQDQMRNSELGRIDPQYGEGRDQQNIGRGFGGIPPRESDSPSHYGRSVLDDLFGTTEGRTRGLQGRSGGLGSNEHLANVFNQTPGTASTQGPFSMGLAAPIDPATPGANANNLTSSVDQESSAVDSQIPVTQQRQMVMPDRMRWIYRDPQGNTQGPWSGLEMHDWYKAGFFLAELQVKKVEDTEYEPLAQLIRRIGNSREPFLVPQIGIPHGPANASMTQPGPVLGSIPAASPIAQAGSAQPPFASSFPSFGTTLTAEQQNALERRKQEEQYLMARQKEHLAQQQVMLKQMHLQGGPLGIHGQQLHHHSSAHSLHSQPSFGSMASPPSGYQPSPAQGPIQPPSAVPGFFDGPMRMPSQSFGQGPIGPSGEQNEMAAHLERLNLGRQGQPPFPSLIGNQPEALTHQQQVNTMLQDRTRLQREQDHYDMINQGAVDEQQSANRYTQFQQLREQEASQGQSYLSDEPRSKTANEQAQEQQLEPEEETPADPYVDEASLGQQEQLSLAEQVQQTAAAQQSEAQNQSPWTKVDSGLPHPFPPPQSISPLPAPAAQRNRQNVADTLAAESRSRSQTPSIDTPSATIAPWARESVENSKGPSLKEIQEAEARKAAQQDEIAAAARRAAAEQERLSQLHAVAPAPGLPLSANWASGQPGTPTSTGPSAWAKPLAGKNPVATPISSKKTLAQIQKEEENKKQKQIAAAAVNNAANTAMGSATLSSGHRYADLAGKSALTKSSTPAGNAWTTVGAGGKMKAPSGPSAPAPTVRSVSNSTTTVPPVAKAKSGSSTTVLSQNANEEFQKWAKSALGKGLNSSINGRTITARETAFIAGSGDADSTHSRELCTKPPSTSSRT